jgi:hypothetical protein
LLFYSGVDWTFLHSSFCLFAGLTADESKLGVVKAADTMPVKSNSLICVLVVAFDDRSIRGGLL